MVDSEATNPVANVVMSGSRSVQALYTEETCAPLSITSPIPIPTATPSLFPTPAPTFTPLPTPTSAQFVAEVKQAVVRIQTADSIGSGFIFDPDGWILTNAHLVGDDIGVDVILSDNSVRFGLVIGSSLEEDIALVSIEGVELDVVEIGAVNAVGIGDEVFALDYPLDP